MESSDAGGQRLLPGRTRRQPSSPRFGVRTWRARSRPRTASRARGAPGRRPPSWSTDDVDLTTRTSIDDSGNGPGLLRAERLRRRRVSCSVAIAFVRWPIHGSPSDRGIVRPAEGEKWRRRVVARTVVDVRLGDPSKSRPRLAGASTSCRPKNAPSPSGRILSESGERVSSVIRHIDLDGTSRRTVAQHRRMPRSSSICARSSPVLSSASNAMHMR